MVETIGTVLNGTMVNYMLMFFMSVGVLYLAYKGASVLWSGISTTWSALRTDVKEASRQEISVFRLWRNRVNMARPVAERIG